MGVMREAERIQTNTGLPSPGKAPHVPAAAYLKSSAHPELANVEAVSFRNDVPGAWWFLASVKEGGKRNQLLAGRRKAPSIHRYLAHEPRLLRDAGRRGRRASK
jgi:hypothetical protein